jgi:hypothetical protein
VDDATTPDSDSDRYTLGVVYGVPAEVQPTEVVEGNDLRWAKQMAPSANSGQPGQPDTYTHLIAVDGDLPSYVTVALFMRLKVRPYLPRPMQCKQCWAYGHTTARLRRRVSAAWGLSPRNILGKVISLLDDVISPPQSSLQTYTRMGRTTHMRPSDITP